MTTTTQLSLLRHEINDQGVVTLWLDGNDRPVVVLDRELIQRLNTTLDVIEQEKNVNALFLRSDCSKVFVAGADLAEIDGLDDPALHAYLAFGTTVFGRLAKLPYPGQIPKPVSGNPMRYGLSFEPTLLAIIASQCIAISKPPPSEAPEMSARDG